MITLKHMNQLNTAINPGVQTDFKTKDGKSHGNCWALSSLILYNNSVKTQKISGKIIKNTDEDDLKKTNSHDQLTTSEKFVNELLNKDASSNDKIDVKYGQNDLVTQKLLDRWGIKTVSFEMPNDWKTRFDHDERKSLCLKTQAWLLLKHFSNSDTPVLWTTYGRKVGHQTAIMGINTFDKDVMLGNSENDVAFPGSLVTFEHFKPNNKITCYNTIYPYSSEELEDSFYDLHIGTSSLTFVAEKDSKIKDTKSCKSLEDIRTQMVPLITKK